MGEAQDPQAPVRKERVALLLREARDGCYPLSAGVGVAGTLEEVKDQIIPNYLLSTRVPFLYLLLTGFQNQPAARPLVLMEVTSAPDSVNISSNSGKFGELFL